MSPKARSKAKLKLNKFNSSESVQGSLVRGVIWTSLAVGLGLCLMPLIIGVREQRRLLRRPKGRVVRAPFKIDIDQSPAYD